MLVLVSIFGLPSLIGKPVESNPPVTNTVGFKTLTPIPPSKTKTPTLTVTPTELVTATPTSLPTEITDEKGVKMVLVPEGDFIFGDSSKNTSETVFLEKFYIDQYEVTNGEYAKCVKMGACKTPIQSTASRCGQYSKFYTQNNMPNCFRTGEYYGEPSYTNYPVIYVDSGMSEKYCEWRGAHLPLETQWEKAAHGANGYFYPWGNTNISCDLANYAFCVGSTVSVGSYEKGKSPYNVYDMLGNVWEWINVQYDSTKDLSPSLRGGSFGVFSGSTLWPYRRTVSPAYANYDTGFRCVRDVTP